MVAKEDAMYRHMPKHLSNNKRRLREANKGTPIASAGEMTAPIYDLSGNLKADIKAAADAVRADEEHSRHRLGFLLLEAKERNWGQEDMRRVTQFSTSYCATLIKHARNNLITEEGDLP